MGDESIAAMFESVRFPGRGAAEWHLFLRFLPGIGGEADGPRFGRKAVGAGRGSSWYRCGSRHGVRIVSSEGVREKFSRILESTGCILGRAGPDEWGQIEKPSPSREGNGEG
jgi:hypothetical protein